ncbi:predicted protein [Histoplasma capsulatum G186AR]|uniref:Uncharacterized protein n=1 Tax=Ajellomyces capsulatus (strain G186AR / H82 / ATCC MYA-2454 / RMSCC 2432) TaxID=447093 RepID=C0NH43_AJECG|nr:uncharacterized protein HCBG_02665 [Histoplasma capsulatum G186AR]EEH09128.1 predicted protein [Histoplasma capsulatum G186AR]
MLYMSSISEAENVKEHPKDTQTQDTASAIAWLKNANPDIRVYQTLYGSWAVSRGLLQQRPLHQHDYGRAVSGWRSYLMQPILGTFPDKQGIRAPMFKRQRQWLNDKTSRPHRLAVPCSLRLSAISKKV